MSEKLQPANEQGSAKPRRSRRPPGKAGDIEERGLLGRGSSWKGANAVPGSSEAPADWVESGLAILDANGRITDVNETLSAWLDRESSALVGRSFWEALAERCPEWTASLAGLRQATATFGEIDLRLPTEPAAPSQWFRLELARHVAGGFARFHSVLPPLSDLAESSWDEYLRTESAQREMFVRLLRAESQLKTLVGRWPGVIFSQRADFTFRFVSPKIEALTGVSIAEWQSKPHLFWHVVHEGDAEELRQQFEQARRTGQAVSCTYRIRNPQTGRIAYVMEHRQPNVSRGGLLLGYEGVWLDVTRQTIAEKRLSSAAWKETLSVLTMGLAHDFGNVMAGIHALSESFLEQVGASHEFSEGLVLIKKNTQQASHLVHRIINLHQGKTGDNNYHDLNEITTDLADLVRKVIPRRMQFSVTLAEQAIPVYLDAVELRQVVMNLVLNAVDAMPQTGRLILRTSRHESAPDLTQHQYQGVWPRVPAACLALQDSGCGIKPQYLAGIFDPFFTTKAMNKGSGLGLYNARLFVEKYRGAISVESKEGAGTTFFLWLPQADFGEAEAAAPAETAAGSRRSLLLAGPAGKTQDGTAEFLRLAGYHVVSASSAEAAMAAAQSKEHSFAGLMLLAEPGGLAWFSAVPAIRREQPDSKLILKVMGCDPDELPLDLLRQVDLVIPAELSQASILEKLEKAF